MMNTNIVLILSDNLESSSIWTDAFGRHGLESVCVRKLDEVGIEISAVLMLVDFSESVAEGLRACRQLRSRSAMPILLVLPSASSADVLAAYQAGATECVIRPASPAVVLLKALAWSMRGKWAAQLDESMPNLAHLLVAV